ncbi:uncharacterized protein C4orf45 homolog [Sphaeramia orbicularis]|uniref:uncharacterized protein C4orf45 homolog n=1 Tax=Sphaeramia orbicularis TaxID=375764 RepID=UPI00117E9B16|nr:uncharacterized protein C4orf45 homolog [Sphaeramia orbicularis]
MPTSDAAVEKPQYGQRMIFTGPDGIGDYRPRSNYFPQYISEGSGSPEATGDLSYLFRAAPLAPLSTPKQSYVGEIGWGWRYNQQLNGGTLLSNMQIKKTDIRAAVEDRISHMFQTNKQKNMTDDSQVDTKVHRNSRR